MGGLAMTGARHVLDDLGFYVLGRLGDQDHARVEFHIVDCDGCREAYEYIRDISNLLALQNPDDFE
jgi:anti-sigma factor RsiW